MDFSILFDLLFEKLDMQAIVAVVGISYALQKARVPERLMPLVPLGLGALTAYYRVEKDWELWAIYYAGGASIAYNLMWTTLLNKINLFEIAANILLKIKNRKIP